MRTSIHNLVPLKARIPGPTPHADGRMAPRTVTPAGRKRTAQPAARPIRGRATGHPAARHTDGQIPGTPAPAPANQTAGGPDPAASRSANRSPAAGDRRPALGPADGLPRLRGTGNVAGEQPSDPPTEPPLPHRPGGPAQPPAEEPPAWRPSTPPTRRPPDPPPARPTARPDRPPGRPVTPEVPQGRRPGYGLSGPSASRSAPAVRAPSTPRISAQMASAVSAGVRAPRSRPIGP